MMNWCIALSSNLIAATLDTYSNQHSNPALVSLLYLPTVFYDAFIDATFFNSIPDRIESVTIVVMILINVVWLVYTILRDPTPNQSHSKK